jgi:hypothetical protein
VIVEFNWVPGAPLDEFSYRTDCATAKHLPVASLEDLSILWLHEKSLQR